MNGATEFFNLESTVKKYTTESLKPTLLSIGEEKKSIESINATLQNILQRLAVVEQNNIAFLQEQVNIANIEIKAQRQSQIESSHSLLTKIEQVNAKCDKIIPTIEAKLEPYNSAFQNINTLTQEIAHTHKWFENERNNIIQIIHQLQSSYANVISSFDTKYNAFNETLKLFRENYERIEYNCSENTKVIQDVSKRFSEVALSIVQVDNKKVNISDYETCIKELYEKSTEIKSQNDKIQVYLSNIEEYITIYIPLQTEKQMGEAFLHFTSDEYKKKVEEFLFRKVKALFHDLIYSKNLSLLYQMKAIVVDSDLAEEDIQKIPNPSLLALLKDYNPKQKVKANPEIEQKSELKPMQIFDDKAIQTDVKYASRVEEMEVLSKQLNIRLNAAQTELSQSYDHLKTSIGAIAESAHNDSGILHSKLNKLEKMINKSSKDKEGILKPLNDDITNIKDDCKRTYLQIGDLARIIKALIEERLIDNIDILKTNESMYEGLVIKNSIKKQVESDVKISFKGRNYKMHELNGLKRNLIRRSAEMCNNLMQISFPSRFSEDGKIDGKVTNEGGNTLIDKFPSLMEPKKSVYTLKSKVARLIEIDKEKQKLDLTLPLSTKHENGEV